MDMISKLPDPRVYTAVFSHPPVPFVFCKTMAPSQTIFATRNQIPRNASVRPLRLYFQ